MDHTVRDADVAWVGNFNTLNVACAPTRLTESRCEVKYYDFVVVGAGTADRMVASRSSKRTGRSTTDHGIER